MLFSTAFGGVVATMPASAQQGGPPTYTYADPQTGHQVVRLSRLEGKDSAGLYFTQNPFTANGDKVVFTHNKPEGGTSLYSLDISPSVPFGSGKTTRLADPKKLFGASVVAPKGRILYYMDTLTIMAVNLDTLKTHVVANLPSDWDADQQSLSGLSLNADETLLVGADTPGAGRTYAAAAAMNAGGPRQNQIDATYEKHMSTWLWTVDVRTGKVNVILRGTDWFNHPQFSPTDPTMILFVHEGPWDKTDRMWLVHTDGSGLTNFRPRTIPGEASGHEFWGPDGKTIWFDHAEGKGRWLVGKNVVGGNEVRYAVTSTEMSVHYNISAEGRVFAGDGGTYNHNTNPMIQLLTPHPDGTLTSMPLASMASNDYTKREPNVKFSPDGQWVMFNSTQSGQSEFYAVKIAK